MVQLEKAARRAAKQLNGNGNGHALPDRKVIAQPPPATNGQHEEQEEVVTTKARREPRPMLALHRTRETAIAFERGDSRLWETACGRFRLRHITGVGGVKVRPKWHVLRMERIAGRVLWDLASRHRKKCAAMRALEKLVSGGEEYELKSGATQ